MYEDYVTMVDTFIFRRSWVNIFRTLSDEQAGQLIKCVYDFTEGKESTPEDPELVPVYELITQAVSSSCKRFIEKHIGREGNL